MLLIYSLSRWFLKDLREVLQDDTSWFEGDLDWLMLLVNPAQNVVHICLLYLELITVADCGLQQDTNGEWQAVWNQENKHLTDKWQPQLISRERKISN